MGVGADVSVGAQGGSSNVCRYQCVLGVSADVCLGINVGVWWMLWRV